MRNTVRSFGATPALSPASARQSGSGRANYSQGEAIRQRVQTKPQKNSCCSRRSNSEERKPMKKTANAQLGLFLFTPAD